METGNKQRFHVQRDDTNVSYERRGRVEKLVQAVCRPETVPTGVYPLDTNLH